MATRRRGQGRHRAQDQVKQRERLSRRACRRHRRKHLALRRVGRRTPTVAARVADEDAPSGKGFLAPPVRHLRQHIQRGTKRTHAAAAGIGDHPRFGSRRDQPVRAPPGKLCAISFGLRLVGCRQNQNVKVLHGRLFPFAVGPSISQAL